MIQWLGVLVAVLGLAYTGFKDYQKGDIKIPRLTKVVYPIQYCLMAYDPNVDKVYYQHENGIWYDYAPQQRRYGQTQSQEQVQVQNPYITGYAVGDASGSQGGSGGYIVR